MENSEITTLDEEVGVVRMPGMPKSPQDDDEIYAEGDESTE